MTTRFYADLPLYPGASVSLPRPAARHVQVLRLQPGDRITVFNGEGAVEGEFDATIERMGSSDVDVIIGVFTPTLREAPRCVHLAVGMPANERMDWLVEKATELGVASIQPLMTERSVLRLKGERADKKVAHWRGIAIAACEQCRRNRIPVVHEVMTLDAWLGLPLSPDAQATAGRRLLLSLRHGSLPLAGALTGHAGAVTFLNGPEGGLSLAEEDVALTAGFAATSLGPRVLRAETAPLACLAWLTSAPA